LKNGILVAAVSASSQRLYSSHVPGLRLLRFIDDGQFDRRLCGAADRWIFTRRAGSTP
jgi:hypothetical protein